MKILGSDLYKQKYCGLLDSLDHGNPGKTTFTNLANVGPACSDGLFAILAIADTFTLILSINLPKP